MLNRFTSRELTEWKAFSAIEPIGQDREDVRMALLLSMLGNIYRAANDRAFTPQDFIVDWWGEYIPQDWREQKRIMAGVAAIQRGVKRVKRNSSSR